MGMEGLSIGDMNLMSGILLRIIKFMFLFCVISTILLLETHLLWFCFLNILVQDYHFELIKNPTFIEGIYNNGFLHHFSKMVSKVPYILNFAVIIIIASIIYVSYKHSKIKRFPIVIISTLKNNILLILILTIALKLLSTWVPILAYFLLVAPVGYAVYLFEFKNRDSKPKTEQFEKKSEKEENPDGFVFETNSGVIKLENPYRGIYVQGGAGSGKSASIFEPLIIQAGAKDFTGLLYDFKSPELTEKLFLSYENSNIKVRNVDFKHPLLSDRVNPIHPMYLIKSAIANEYSQVIINNLLPESIKKNDFWISSAKHLLAGVIWWLRQQHPEICTLPHVISFILQTPIETLIEEISKDSEAGGMVASLRGSIELGADRTVAGMLSTLQNALAPLNSPDLYWILSSNDVNLHLNNPDNPQFLCIGNDSTLPTVYTPAISLIISVALRQMNQPDQQKSVVLLDEAPTIFIPNIEQIPATARSNKIATVFAVQDYTQLVDKYSEDKAQVVIANLGNQFFGRTTNYKTAEMIQNLFSKHDETFISKNDGGGTSGTFIHTNNNTSVGTSENIQERHRVKIPEIVNLEQGQFYGFIAEGSPREFLKCQFKRNEIKGQYINPKIPINDEIMKENYFRIIAECKEIIS